MATQTQVLKRGTVQPARLHDYIYGTFQSSISISRSFIDRFLLDPTCTLSGVRDHARETFIAKTTSEQLVCRSNLQETSFQFICFVLASSTCL